MFWVLEVQDQSVSRSGFPWGLFPWFPDGHISTVSSCGHFTDISFSYFKCTSHIGLRPYPYDLISYLPLVGPISKMLLDWESRLQCMNLGEHNSAHKLPLRVLFLVYNCLCKINHLNYVGSTFQVCLPKSECIFVSRLGSLPDSL